MPTVICFCINKIPIIAKALTVTISIAILLTTLDRDLNFPQIYFLFSNHDIDDKISAIINNIRNIERIEFQNVSLKRGDFELKDFTFTFEKNNSYALVGHSGAGKSTIFDILTGLIPIEQGVIKVNGIEVNGYLDIIAMQYFSVIKQHSHIFDADFMDNVTNFSAYNFDDIKQNRLHTKFLSRLVNKNSQDLSGGEKQMLSILKSSISNKQVYLFDEVCSAIDKKTLSDIRAYINNMNCGILIEISHHFNCSDYSHIIEMENGRIKHAKNIS